MNTRIKIIVWGVLVLLFSSCEKDHLTRSVSDAEERQAALISDLKSGLQDAKDGWVMMVKSSLSEVAYTPIVMKFDTVKNTVAIRTVYGLSNAAPTYFEIGKGTAQPLLTFSTGSLISALYRIGAEGSDLTDHIFKVMNVSKDTVTLQCYRSGGVYQPEGGATYQLFRRPKGWKWADEYRYFDLDDTNKWQQNFLNPTKEIALDIVDQNKTKTASTIWTNSAILSSLLTTFRRNDPFNRDVSTKALQPFHVFWIYFRKENNSYQTAVTVGHNALSFFPFSVNQNISTSTHVRYLADHLGTHYFVAKDVRLSGSQLDIDFVAYGKQGEEVLTTTYTSN